MTETGPEGTEMTVVEIDGYAMGYLSIPAATELPMSEWDMTG